MPGMTVAPDQHMIDDALQIAAGSPCRSKRGVVLYDFATGACGVYLGDNDATCTSWLAWSGDA